MPTRISYTSFDHESVTIVPVIATYDTEGNFYPLYVGIDHTQYKISSCKVNSMFGNITEFICKIIDGDSLKPLKLTYYPGEHMWTIPQYTAEADS